MYTSYTYTNSPLEKFIGLLTLSRAFANHVCACSGMWEGHQCKMNLTDTGSLLRELYC